jgi:hypothetical protein
MSLHSHRRHLKITPRKGSIIVSERLKFVLPIEVVRNIVYIQNFVDFSEPQTPSQLVGQEPDSYRIPLKTPATISSRKRTAPVLDRFQTRMRQTAVLFSN